VGLPKNIDIEHAYQSVIDTLNIILDDIVPVTKTTLNIKILVRDPWMTKGLIKSSNKSKILYSKTLGKPKKDPNYIHYVTYRNKYNQLKRIAKQLYYASLFEKYHNNAKMVWRTINSILNRSADKTIITTAFKVDSNIITNPKHISNEFCNLFYKYWKNIHNDKSIYLTPTDYNETLKILQDLKSKRVQAMII